MPPIDQRNTSNAQAVYSNTFDRTATEYAMKYFEWRVLHADDVAALAQQTIRVNVANANALKERRDAFVRFVKALSRSIDWAYSDPKAIDNYADIAKVPRALAQRTRDDFFPKEGLQLSEVKGLDVTLKQALDFKYITSPITVADAQGMLDILYKPEKK